MGLFAQLEVLGMKVLSKILLFVSLITRGASRFASARARGLFGWPLFAAVAIFAAPGADANSVPLHFVQL
jgi:hypothetical protein